MDLLKGLLLLVVLGGPLLAAVLWVFDRTGDAAWLWCFGVTTAFLVGVQFVAPTWIMSLFYKFQPLGDGQLKRAVLAYTRREGFPLEDVFVIDGSKRSTKANAFLTGFGKRKRIALFDTLIEQHSTDEVVAMVAHEIGHFKKKHILKELALGIAQVGVIFFLLSLVLRDAGLFEAFHVSRPSTYVGLLLFGIAYTPIGLALSFAVQAHSRRNEFEADAFARETTGRGEVLARALEKLSAQSLSNLTPHPFYVKKLHHSHPPPADRVSALRAPDPPETPFGRSRRSRARQKLVHGVRDFLVLRRATGLQKIRTSSGAFRVFGPLQLGPRRTRPAPPRRSLSLRRYPSQSP